MFILVGEDRMIAFNHIFDDANIGIFKITKIIWNEKSSMSMMKSIVYMYLTYPYLFCR